MPTCPNCAHTGTDEEFDDDVNCTLDDISDVYEASDLPCFLTFYREVDSLYISTPVTFLLLKMAEEADTELMQFSVTSQEPRYQEFLDAIEGIPGVQVYELERHGPTRTVYLCTVPTYLEL